MLKKKLLITFFIIIFSYSQVLLSEAVLFKEAPIRYGLLTKAEIIYSARVSPITGGDRNVMLYFSEIKNKNNLSPVIYRNENKLWHEINFTHSNFSVSGWVYALRVVNSKMMWAVIDTKVTGYGWYLHIVYSADMGKSWRYQGKIKKNYFNHVIYSMKMNQLGEGEIIIDSTEDLGALDHALGYYRYVTTNKGRDWSKGCLIKSFSKVIRRELNHKHTLQNLILKK